MFYWNADEQKLIIGNPNKIPRYHKVDIRTLVIANKKAKRQFISLMKTLSGYMDFVDDLELDEND